MIPKVNTSGNKLAKYTEATVIQEAHLFLSGHTIPRISKDLGIPKSTVSWHLIKPLKRIDFDLYTQVRERLNKFAKDGLRFNEDLRLISIYYEAKRSNIHVQEGAAQ